MHNSYNAFSSFNEHEFHIHRKDEMRTPCFCLNECWKCSLKEKREECLPQYEYQKICGTLSPGKIET